MRTLAVLVVALGLGFACGGAAPAARSAAPEPEDEPAEEPAPMPPPGEEPDLPPLTVPPDSFGSHWMSGVKEIEPEPSTVHQPVAVGVKVCVAPDGSVESASLMKSTGVASYDEKILDAMRAWRYRPFVINGEAARVCSAVTFLRTPK